MQRTDWRTSGGKSKRAFRMGGAKGLVGLISTQSIRIGRCTPVELEVAGLV